MSDRLLRKSPNFSTTVTAPVAGTFVRLALAALAPPIDAGSGARLLMAAAPLIVMPLALDVLELSVGWWNPPRSWGAGIAAAEPGRLSGTGIAAADAALVRSARRAGFPAAVCVAVALSMPPGPLPAALSAPWLLVTLALSTAGLLRLTRDLPTRDTQLPRRWSALCLDAGLAYTVVGGFWLLVDRTGLNFGYPDIIVLLTGVHFHYAATVALIVAGGAGAWLAHRPVSRMAERVYAVAAAGMIFGMILVATGFLVTGVDGGFAVLWETGAVACLALVNGWVVAPRIPDAPARRLLVAGSAAFLVTMLLASLYAVTWRVGLPAVSITTMVRWHGWGNLIGVVAWLLAWRRILGQDH